MTDAHDRRFAALASRVRTLVAPVIRECPPECGIVSIIEVEVSSDYTFATVTISALSKPELALAFLQKRKHELQKAVSKLGTKLTPKIRFKIDRTSERGSRIDNLLAQEEKFMSKSLDILPPDDSSKSQQDHRD